MRTLVCFSRASRGSNGRGLRENRGLRQAIWLFSLILWAEFSGPIARAQYVTDIGQIAIDGIPTDWGYVDVTIYPTFTASSGFLNIVCDLNGNGIGPDDWHIQNFQIPMVALPGFFGKMAPGEFRVEFPLGGLTPSGSFDVYASFGAGPLQTANAGKQTINLARTFSVYDIQDIRSGVPGFAGGAAPRDTAVRPARGRAAGAGSAQKGASAEEAPDDAPPAGVRTDIPGIKQRPDECGPTATAQSLRWLEKNGKITLPKNFNGKAGDRGLIDELKGDMGWQQGAGVQPTNFTSGKNTFVSAHNLPLTVEQGGADNGDGTVDFIKAQIAKGQDVELWLDFFNQSMHVVTVAGTSTNADKSTSLWIVDPVDGKLSGYPLGGKGDKAGKVLTNYPYDAGNGNKIMFAVAESPKS